MKEDIEVVLIDVGNSSIKTTEVRRGKFEQAQPKTQNLAEILSQYKDTPAIISSVRKLDGHFLQSNDIVVLTHKTKIPLKLDYETPETLGSDRIAAAVGVYDLFPEQDNLIVDLGTCMTLDLVEKSGIFKGGAISPGLKMRMRAMARETDALPDISEEWQDIPSKIIGQSTRQCLVSGAYWGIVHEINGLFETLRSDFTSLNMILTGGDAHFFESKLKAHIFAGSKIVERGLYQIWKYQQK